MSSVGLFMTSDVSCPGPGWLCRLVVLALVVTGACASPDSARRIRLAIATGDETGVYYLLGRTLADLYQQRITGLEASALETTGSGFNVQAIEEGRAELAFSQADVAYLALQEGTTGHLQPYRRLRAIAVLYVNAVQIATLRQSDIRRLGDLAGRRIGVGAPDSGTEVAAGIILRAHMLQDRVIADPVTFEDVAFRMQNRAIDVGFLVSSYPIPALTRLNAAVGIRLLPIALDWANRIRDDYPFYRPIVVPAGSYAGQEGDVPTIGVDNLLICRNDLPDELVYNLTRVLFDSLPELTAAHPAAAAIDPELASAAPIPLHSGAARFYRERQLFR